MKYLKTHPFGVRAHFEHSVVLTFAVDKAQISALIPECLELDTYHDHTAFIAVAMVNTLNLRPKGFPQFLGSDFFLVGYRIFVRYRDKRGKSLRGLYILKTETNKKRMEVLGNLFTHYQYSTIDVSDRQEQGVRTISSKAADFEVEIIEQEGEKMLPLDSPFDNWQDARKFAGPLPHTFSFDKIDQKVLIVRGLRKHWRPEPIKVNKCYFGFLDSLRLENIKLASVFQIKNIPYEWEKGRVEKWK